MPIDRLIVGGYKSMKERTEVELRGLTLLAGENSSGKSSVVQPLLLLKQTPITTPHPAGYARGRRTGARIVWAAFLNPPHLRRAARREFLSGLISRAERVTRERNVKTVVACTPPRSDGGE